MQDNIYEVPVVFSSDAEVEERILEELKKIWEPIWRPWLVSSTERKGPITASETGWSIFIGWIRHQKGVVVVVHPELR